jgi:hypothetical protein
MGAQRNIPLAGDAARRMYPGKRTGLTPPIDNARARAMAEAEYQANKQSEYDKRFGARF